MLRLLARAVLSLLANAVGLLAASALLDGFSINATSFIVAVVVFTAATVILSPLIVKVALTSAPYLVGGIALVTTFVGLLITDLFTNGLSISGLSTWIIATLIIWVCAIIANLILPLFIFKKTLDHHKKHHAAHESEE